MAKSAPNPAPAKDEKKSSLEKVGALWVKTSASGKPMMQGMCRDERITIFKNGFKTEEKHPSYIIYVSTDAPATKKDLGAGKELEEDELPF